MEKLNEGMQGTDLMFDAVPEDVLADETEMDTLAEMLKEIEQQAQLSLIAESGEFDDYSVQDLMIAILSKFDRSQKLSEVKLSDLVALFLDMQSLKANR